MRSRSGAPETATSDEGGGAVTAKTEGPLYLRLAQILKSEIITGVFPVGSQLPTEDVLRERFSVSRFTVREAVRRLREEGLVASRQGAGTVVVPARGSALEVLSTVSIDDLVAIGNDTRFVIDFIGMIKVDAKLANRLAVDKGDEWLAVTGMRCNMENTTPISLVDYYINREYASIGRLLPRHSGPIFYLIEDAFAVAIAEVQQEIAATVITPALAARLNVAEGSAALEVRRVYKVDDDKVAQITFNIYPASTYRHSMTLRRMRS